MQPTGRDLDDLCSPIFFTRDEELEILKRAQVETELLRRYFNSHGLENFPVNLEKFTATIIKRKKIKG